MTNLNVIWASAELIKFSVFIVRVIHSVEVVTIPERVPVVEDTDRPSGSEPEEIEKRSSLPVINGVIETGELVNHIICEGLYEKSEGGVRTWKVRSAYTEAIPFCALIFTVPKEKGDEAVPEITPVEEERERPDGREPDETENWIASPVIAGVNETFELVVNKCSSGV